MAGPFVYALAFFPAFSSTYSVIKSPLLDFSRVLRSYARYVKIRAARVKYERARIL